MRRTLLLLATVSAVILLSFTAVIPASAGWVNTDLDNSSRQKVWDVITPQIPYTTLASILSPSLLRKWGNPGSGDGQFNLPSGIAVDPAGNVYIADQYNHRIQKFTSNGTFITKWGMISRNVADAVSAPRPTLAQIKTWDENEVAAFLDAAKKSQYFALFYTALFTGARRSELLALTWADG
ncbi:MAG: hypothetical protein V1894_03145 [Chloroflexota bacterium]